MTWQKASKDQPTLEKLKTASVQRPIVCSLIDATTYLADWIVFLLEAARFAQKDCTKHTKD